MKESRDILILFEALNGHEVFTPPRVAREILNLLPTEIWSDPSIKILDPCCKSGVFLREAFYRLFTNLNGKGVYETKSSEVYDLSDKQQRINHILKNMLFGIATSELTGYVSRRTLYGVMRANSDKQLSSIDAFEKSSNFNQWTEEQKYDFIGRNKFNEYFDHNLFCTTEYQGFEEQGNIFYPNAEVQKIRIEQDNYEIEDKYFPFIEESTKHKKILDMRVGKMKFDVIIGNPPYQVSDGGNSRSAKPVYQTFVEQAMSLEPHHLVMITPSRWFVGGKGLDAFRERMLGDKRIRTIVDFKNASDVFPGVDVAGGISYFHWQKNTSGPVRFVTEENGQEHVSERDLSEFPVLIRSSHALHIVKKVNSVHEGKPFLNTRVSARKPFGMPTNYTPKSQGIPCWFIQKHGLQFALPGDVKDTHSILQKWKVLLPKAPIAGQTDFTKPIRFYQNSNTRIAAPGEACTESWIVGGAFDTEAEATNFRAYLYTKIVRFLLLQGVISQDVTRTNFLFVPDLEDYTAPVTDQQLVTRFGLTDEEWQHIDSRILDTE